MKRAITFLLLLSLLISCKKTNDTQLLLDEQRRADSLALHVAIVPTLASLPLYYAERLGLADSLGLDMRLHHYSSFMDADTAFYRQRVHVFVTDSVRLAFIQKKWSAKSIFAVPEPLALILKRESSHQKLTGLFEETIGISRHCADETWCLQLIDSARMSIYDVYRPQVHDIVLRSQMLQNKLLDAAILSEPYVTLLHKQGCPLLATCTNGPLAKILFAANDTLTQDPHRLQQITLLEKVYNEASNLINKGYESDNIKSILLNDYGVSTSQLDSISIPRSSQLVLP